MLKRKRVLIALATLMILAASLSLPLSASAGRAVQEHGSLFVPPDANDPCVLTVGRISVTIPPGSMPDGGPVILHVSTTPDNEFTAHFLPNRQFELPVVLDFGSAETVYYHRGNSETPLQTGDVDGDGDGGEISSDHFSRYSGWY